MNQSIIDGLKTIVGEEFVTSGPEAACKFLRPGQKNGSMVVLSPSCDEELQKTVDLARENKIAIITVIDHHILDEDLDKEGILLDFSRMNKIESIDARNLMAHVQRGVTWEQLNAELKPLGIKAVAPIAANSASVAESHYARVVGKAVSKFCDYPLNNLRLVMANGRIHRTGTHGLSPDAADGRHEGGPNLSNWFFGSDDIFGIMTRASILLWPICESRTCRVYAFDDTGEMLTAIKDVPRNEMGIEYLGINRVSMQKILGGDEKDYPAWSLVIGFEGRTKRVDHNKDRVDKLMKRYTCRQEDRLVDPMAEQLDLPWMTASNNHTGFYTLFSNIKNIETETDKAAAAAGIAPEQVGKIYAAYDYGRAVYAVYDWFSGDDHGSAINALNLSLADLGAFFDRPHGQLGRKIYTSIPNHLPVLKQLKEMLDPDHILNPGRIIKEEDPIWQPPKTGEGEIGPTVSNLQTVKNKLIESVGQQWVSDNPVDLSAYGRDFTIFSGERPNIAVLPRTTEEVQAIIKIAYEHGIPVVPLSTGFNHGGLAISRKGGILIDLKRMNELMVFDEEAMTISIGPGVRMRTIWWETVKRRANEEFHLKPILPLTLGSVSLLSNYVARGGAGSLFKYGLNTELTAGMTWVLPNGEILKVGPSAIPNVGNLPLHFTVGPDLFGMFFNADGMFGVCTELTAKLYPERDNAEAFEDIVSSANFDPDFHHAFCQTVEAIHELGQENITDFIYKAHPGLFALAMVDLFDGLTIQGVIGTSPQHPLATVVSGYDAEELEIKKEIVAEVVKKYGLMVIDPAMFGEEIKDMQTTASTKMSLGVKENFAATYKGAFQWTACNMKMEKVPEFALRYEKLVQKYWKTSDPKISVEHAMTGTDIQGPLPYSRMGGVEVDFWWDQGNPEDVKRATTMMHKTQKLMLDMGGCLFRNMFGAGEYHLPLWGKTSEYLSMLKGAKAAFDPNNLMHPDVSPLTDDYV